MRWTPRPTSHPETVKHLGQELKISPAIAALLAQRGVETFEEAKAFFRPDLKALHNPFLMQDMDKAVARILQALAQNEKIMVYGDYDVDGTTSVALMSTFLENFSAHTTCYIPDRYAEGYGISYKGIDRAAELGTTLIIALDCGIKAIDKVAYAAEKGIDFIICDHHRPGETIPAAVAVLDPKRADCAYPYKELCGCGVGFKLIQAIASRKGIAFKSLQPYLDLVATAIGADIVPITGENRILAYHGLKWINEHPRPGFQAMVEELHKYELTITDVVFIIAPRINAAGRMKHALHAVELLKETNPEKAKKCAEEVNSFNTDRKEADRRITAEALRQIEEAQEEDRFTTVVYDENWHKGVIGIVASRLTETYYRPTLVFTKSGDKLAASARSVKGFDVYNALEACQEHIEQFGGHKYAAGLTLKEESYAAFKAAFEAVVKATIDKALLTPEINYAAELQFSEITPKFHRILKQFAPFGPGNMTPVFRSKKLTDKGFAKAVGKEGDHLKCALQQWPNTAVFEAIGFGMGDKLDLLKNKTEVEALYSLDENHWNGAVSLQLKLRDLRVEEE